MDNTKPDKSKVNHTEKPVVFFDGHCVLCSFLADWLITRAKDKFYVAALQGETAKRLGLYSEDPNTIVYWSNDKSYQKSEAAILLLVEASPTLRFLQIVLFLPKTWVDSAYDLIAKNRFKWFGKRSTCRVPTPEEKACFLP